MRIAFVVYTGMTTLDFVAVFDPLTRLKTMGFLEDQSWDICAVTPEVSDPAGLRLIPSRVKPTLADYAMVVVPGGFATRQLQKERSSSAGFGPRTGPGGSSPFARAPSCWVRRAF
jgi:cyclohexyl-isocyanide hydratase